MHKVKQFVKSKSLSSNLCLDFNKQEMVISQKFSKYDGMQLLIDDSRWVKAEFSSPTVSGQWDQLRSQLAKFMPSGLVCD